MIPFVNPNPVQPLRRTFKELIKDAGLIGNLVMCFDAGDGNSYNSNNSQLFRDTGTGSAYDFTLGATSSVSTDDPTFAGSVNAQTSGESLNYNGSQFFQLSAASNDTFINGMHQTSALWTTIGIIWPVASVRNVLFSTYATSASANIGTHLQISTTGVINVDLGNGSATLQDSSTATVVNGQPNIAGMGRQIISATNRNTATYLNGTYLFANSTTSFTTSTSGASRARIGANADLSLPSGNGTKIEALAIFNALLTQANFDAIRSSCQRRWSTI